MKVLPQPLKERVTRYRVEQLDRNGKWYLIDYAATRKDLMNLFADLRTDTPDYRRNFRTQLRVVEQVIQQQNVTPFFSKNLTRWND